MDRSPNARSNVGSRNKPATTYNLVSSFEDVLSLYDRRVKNFRFQSQADMITSAMEVLGLTTEYQLAKRLNWPQSTLTRYKLGKSFMDQEHMLRFIRETRFDAIDVLEAVVNDKTSRGQTMALALQ